MAVQRSEAAGSLAGVLHRREVLALFALLAAAAACDGPRALEAAEHVADAVAEGALVIDSSSAHWGDAKVPQIVPEVNPFSVGDHHGIVASPSGPVPPIALVLDALRPAGAHPVHATMAESVALARRLRPRRTLLVGMGHAIAVK